MATYSNTNNTSTNGNKEIKYLNKNYTQFKKDLIDFTKNYFPENFNDFSESNPGMIFLELASYVGDVLSFYTDTQVQETFIESATEKENLLALAYNLGYKPLVTNPSTTNVDLFIQIPSDSSNNYQPDFSYAPIINKNSTFLSTEGNATTFLLEDDVNFQFSSSFDPTEVNIYSVDGGNNPEYYLVKKTGKVISAEIKTQTFELGDPEKFLTLNINQPNVIGIESVIDSNNNEYVEVPYLAQETIFDAVSNIEANNPNLNQYNQDTPYLLRLKTVPKRFVTRYTSNNNIQLQFGAGITSLSDEDIIPNPDNIGLGIRDGRSLLDFAFDPSNFLLTKTYGEVPNNTTLTVNYLVGGGTNANVEANTINRKNNIILTQNNGNLNSNLVNTVRQSIAVTNPFPAVGGGPGDSIEDIRLNSIASNASQLRTVSKDDYIIRTLNLPNKFGRVAKAYIIKDDQIDTINNERINNPSGLNLFVLGYNNNKQLVNLNPATRQNLITYLEQYKMLTDSINIKDAFIINFGVKFDIVAFKNFNNQTVLLDCITALKEYFNIDNWQINQPIIINEIYNIIGGVKGVQNVENVEFSNKSGISLGYSQFAYDFSTATINNVIYPSLDTSIFELKYPDNDIQGRIIKY